MVFGKNGKDNVKRLINQSTRAICHPQERELNINPKNISIVKNKLRSKGFRIIGTSEQKDKIWFISRSAITL